MFDSCHSAVPLYTEKINKTFKQSIRKVTFKKITNMVIYNDFMDVIILWFIMQYVNVLSINKRKCSKEMSYPENLFRVHVYNNILIVQ